MLRMRRELTLNSFWQFGSRRSLTTIEAPADIHGGNTEFAARCLRNPQPRLRFANQPFIPSFAHEFVKLVLGDGLIFFH